MNIYIFNFLSLFVYRIISLLIQNKKIGRQVFIALMTLQMTIIAGFRSYRVGIDSARYARFFLEVGNSNSLEYFMNYDMEFLYKVVQKVIFIFSQSYSVYFVLVAFITYLVLGLAINENTTNVFFAYFLYITLGFFEFTLSGMRQGMVISLGLLLFRYAKKKQLKKFLVGVLICSLLHYSAVILLPIYFLYNYRFSKKSFSIVVLLYLVMFFFRYRIGEFLTLIYFDNESILSQYEVSQSVGGLSIFILLLLILGIILRRPLDNEYVYFNGLFNLLIVSFFLQTLSSFSYLFTRLNFYYFSYLIFYIPELLVKMPSNLNDDNKLFYNLMQFSIIVIIIVFFSTYYISGVNSNINNLLPYSFFWES